MALLGRQHRLAQPDGFGGHLHKLVLADKADGLLQGHRLHRREQHGVILAGGADIGQFLLLAGVDIQIGSPVVFADNHAFVDRGSGVMKSRPRGSRL